MRLYPDPVEQPRDDAPFPGPLYPNRCLECAEILREAYGCEQSERCAKCVAADRSTRSDD